MATKRALAQQLGVVAGFEDPRAPLEQYRTPPELAAHLVHLADLRDDVDGRTVLDLGCGTGMLALGAALRGPDRVVGVDIDRRRSARPGLTSAKSRRPRPSPGSARTRRTCCSDRTPRRRRWS